MNNNTETLEQAAEQHIEKLYNAECFEKERQTLKNRSHADFIAGANWQKEQDKAKSVQEKIEAIFDKHSWNEVKEAFKERGITSFVIGIDDEGIKYKTLLESHNELLQMLFDVRPLVQPVVYCKGDDFIILKGKIDNLINKTKNI